MIAQPVVGSLFLVRRLTCGWHCVNCYAHSVIFFQVFELKIPSIISRRITTVLSAQSTQYLLCPSACVDMMHIYEEGQCSGQTAIFRKVISKANVVVRHVVRSDTHRSVILGMYYYYETPESICKYSLFQRNSS